MCTSCGRRIWNGDIFVADIEELEILDASEVHARRLNAKEIMTPKNGEKFMPCAGKPIRTISGGFGMHST